MYRPLLTALLLAATIPAAAQHTLRGRVLEGESPVGYATAVLLRDGRQAAGTTTDDAGSFVLTADTGHYTLVLRHVAYHPFEQEVCVAAADTDLGDLPFGTSRNQRGDGDRRDGDAAGRPVRGQHREYARTRGTGRHRTAGTGAGRMAG